MKSLAFCLRKFGNDLSQYEKDLLRKTADDYIADGYVGEKANVSAVEELLSELEQEGEDILEQARKQGWVQEVEKESAPATKMDKIKAAAQKGVSTTVNQAGKFVVAKDGKKLGVFDNRSDAKRYSDVIRNEKKPTKKVETAEKEETKQEVKKGEPKKEETIKDDLSGEVKKGKWSDNTDLILNKKEQIKGEVSASQVDLASIENMIIAGDMKNVSSELKELAKVTTRENFMDWLNPGKMLARLIMRQTKEGVPLYKAKEEMRPKAEKYGMYYDAVLASMPKEKSDITTTGTETTQEGKPQSAKGAEKPKSILRKAAPQHVMKADINRAIEKAKIHLAKVANLVALNTSEELREVNPELYDKMVLDDAHGKSAAVWDGQGSIYFFANMYTDANEVGYALIHELGHFSLQDLLGNNLDAVLDRIRSKYQAEIDSRIEQLKWEDNVENRRRIANEIVIDKFVDGSDMTLKKRVIDLIQQLMQKLGFDRITEKDINDLVKSIHDNLINGRPDAATIERLTAVTTHENTTKVSDLGDPKVNYLFDKLKWKSKQEEEIFGTLNNRMLKELEIFERLFGPSKKATMLPGKMDLANRGKRTPVRSIKPYDMGQELERVLKSGQVKKILDPKKSYAEVLGGMGHEDLAKHASDLVGLLNTKNNTNHTIKEVEFKAWAKDKGLKWEQWKHKVGVVEDLYAVREGGSLDNTLSAEGMEEGNDRPGVLSENGKAGYSVDFLLGTCQPTTPCKECYAALKMIRRSTVQKAFRNTLQVLSNPKLFAENVAREVKAIPKVDMPFLRLLGSGDMTTTQQIESFNHMAQLMDRPIQIFSRHHDNLAKLNGTEKAPFIKMGSIDADLYKLYGQEKLKENFDTHGIANAFLFTDESEIPMIVDLHNSHALGLVLSATHKLQTKLPIEIQNASCPCDAGARIYWGSCRTCALSESGCFMAYAGKSFDAKGNIYDTLDVPKGVKASPFTMFLQGVKEKAGASPKAQAYAEIARGMIRKSIALMQMYTKDFIKGKKALVSMKDIRYQFLQTDKVLKSNNLEEIKAYRGNLVQILNKIDEGTFVINPKDTIQRVISYENWKQKKEETVTTKENLEKAKSAPQYLRKNVPYLSSKQYARDVNAGLAATQETKEQKADREKKRNQEDQIVQQIRDENPPPASDMAFFKLPREEQIKKMQQWREDVQKKTSESLSKLHGDKTSPQYLMKTDTKRWGESLSRTKGMYYEMLQETVEKIYNADLENGERQPWSVVPKAKVIKIWKDFVEAGFVRDEKGIDKMADKVARNIVQIVVNTDLLNGPTDPLTQPIYRNYMGKDDDLREQKEKDLWQNGKDYLQMDDVMDKVWGAGAAVRTSDFGIKLTDATEVLNAATAEDKLLAIDRTFNKVHQRFDLASLFIEGGKATLDEIAGAQMDEQLTPQEKKQALREIRNNSEFKPLSRSLPTKPVTPEGAQLVEKLKERQDKETTQRLYQIQQANKINKALETPKKAKPQYLTAEQLSRQMLSTGASPKKVATLKSFLEKIDTKYAGLLDVIKSITHAKLPGKHGETLGKNIRLDTLDEMTLGHEIGEVLSGGKKIARGELREDQYFEDIADAVAYRLMEGAGVKVKTPSDEVLYAMGRADELLRPYEISRTLEKFNGILDPIYTKPNAVQYLAAGDINSKQFKSWFKGSKVVNKDGTPKELYHGSTHDFDQFTYKKVSSESFFGAAHYFTDSPGDASNNYARLGPDLQERIERGAEKLFYDLEDPPEYGTAAYKKKIDEFYLQVGKELLGTAPAVYPVYASMKNPVMILENGTYFEYNYNERTGKESGSATKLYQAMMKTAGEYDIDGQELWNKTMEQLGGESEFSAEKFDEAIRSLDSFDDITDPNTGDLRGMDFLKNLYLNAGFDGIIMDASKQFSNMGLEPGTRHYIIPEGKQIKSVFNRGSWSKTNPKIQYYISAFGPKGKVNPVNQMKLTLWDKIVAYTADAKRALQKLEAGDQEAAISGFKSFKLLHSFPTIFNSFLTHGTPKFTNNWIDIGKDAEGGLFGVVEKLGKDTEAFFDRLTAKSAQELLGKGRKDLFGLDDQGNMQDDQTKINEIIKNTDKMYNSNKQVWDDAEKRLRAINKAVLNFAEDTGIIDEDARKDWERTNYIPFFRVVEDWETGDAKTMLPGDSTKIGTVHQLKGGSEKNIGDPLANLVNQYSFLLHNGLKNVARKKSLAFAKQAGLLEEIKSFPGKKEGRGEIQIRVKGVSKYFKVTDPWLYDALVDIDAHTKSLKLFSVPKRWLTWGVTITGGFRLANVFRDTWHTFFIGNHFVPVWDSIRGAYHVWKDTKEFVEYASTGGAFGGSFATHEMRGKTEEQVKRLHKHAENKDSFWSKMWQGWEKVGEASENAARMGLFLRLRAQGQAATDAGFQARDLLDFHNSGKADWMQYMISSIPFLNARIQGLYKMGRNAVSENTMKQFWIRSMILAAGSFMWGYNNADDDEDRELPDYKKRTYLSFKVGETKIRLPIPFEVGSMFMVLPMALGERMANTRTNKELYTITRDIMLDTFAFNPLPQVMKPAVEQWTNYDTFTGQPIVPVYQQKMEPELQVSPNTKQLYKKVGAGMQALGFRDAASPRRIEKFIRDMFGSIADVVADTADIGIDYFTNEDPAGSNIDRLLNISGASRFIDSKDVPSFTKSQERFYNMVVEFDRAATSFREYKKLGDTETALEYKQEHREEIRMSKMLGKYQDRISKLNAKMKLIHASTKLSQEEKKEQLDQILTDRNAIFKRAVERAQERSETEEND